MPSDWEMMYGHYYMQNMMQRIDMLHMPSLNRDPVRFNALSPLPYGQQIINQTFPSPHKPLYPLK